jgi:hypothetical protein
MSLSLVPERAVRQRLVILEVADRPLGTFDAEMVELLVEASCNLGSGRSKGLRLLELLSKKGSIWGLYGYF